MKVWVLLLDMDYEGSSFCGVFTTPELAKDSLKEIIGKYKAVWAGDPELSMYFRPRGKDWSYSIEATELDAL